MKANLKVTVLVLVYKNAAYIKEALESVYCQTYKNIELIISDDASPNIEKEFFENIKAESEKHIGDVILNINETNMGTVRHLNKVISIAKGDIICPLACDDKFYDDRVLEDIVRYASTSKDYIFTAKRTCVDQSGEKELSIMPAQKEIELLSQEPKKIINHMAVYGSFISGACTYYKKEVFEKYGYFDEHYKLVEDYSYYLNLLLNNGRIGFMDRITIQYRWGGVSTGKKMNPYVYEDMGTILERQIYPNRSILKHWNRRVVELRYQKRFTDRNKMDLYLRYFDVVLFWGFWHLFNRKKS